MIEIGAWLDVFLKALDECFATRVWFVGLQGSYGRGEAHEGSDIDVVVILDECSVADVRAYGEMLDTLPHRELVCGFLSGKDELFAWELSDLFQFYHDTMPLRGSLDGLLPLLDDAAVCRAIKTGVCNVYHGCVHNMLHEKSVEILKGLYKSASFTVQAIVFWQTGAYVRGGKELLSAISPEEKQILEGFWRLKNGGKADLEELSETLLAWAKAWIEKT